MRKTLKIKFETDSEEENDDELADKTPNSYFKSHQEF